MKFFKCSIPLLCILLLVLACNSPYTFKKKGYFKIEFPDKKYQLFDQPGFPYSFEYPVYARVVRDTSFFGDRPENPWWINIDVPSLNGRIYVSYKQIRNSKQIDSLVNDAFKMAYKHTAKATEIGDSVMITPNKLEGIYYSLRGNTATANQFFITDSSRNFLRGALYFNAEPNEDSLGIVNDFLRQDLFHLINTLKWK
jgi:gliding motility-associated lipoprotein GldD